MVPEYPLGALVSFELRDYRAELEQAVAKLADGSPGRQLAERRLAEVIAEQDSRPASRPAGRPDDDRAGW
jgi:hypothetical protein